MNNNNKYNYWVYGLERVWKTCLGQVSGKDFPRYWITFSYQSGQSICIAGEIIQRHKGFMYISTTTTNFPSPQNFSAFFCHMSSLKSINIVSEVVKYDSPDLNRGGTIRENLCRVGYRVRKLKSETSSNLQKFLSHRVNGTINVKQLTMLSLWHIYLAFVNLIPAAKGLGQCLADTSTGMLRQATRWHCTAGRIKQRWKQSYPHNVIERATTNKLYKLINFINLSSQHSLTLHLWRYERNDDGLPFNQSWSYPSSRRI